MKNTLAKTKSGFAKAMAAIDGSSEKGVRNRLWVAIILSIVAILSDYLVLYPNYSALPDTVAFERDWHGAVTRWADKSVFLEFEIQRLFVLIFSVGIGWLLAHFRKTFMAKRLACFIIEMTMLAITTGVGISAVMLEIELGNLDAHVSDYWELVIMLFWAVIMSAELLYDWSNIRKQNIA